MPIKTNFQSPQFQSFHAIAASRGDGLHPELVKLFERLAKGADANISKAVGTSELPNDFKAKRPRFEKQPRSAETTAIAAMSALGQKQTHALQQRMSALPPIPRKRTPAKGHVCFTPRKRTCALQRSMSALGQ
jgi:hypothetical protein